jgi:hypothetical protein
MMGYGSYASVSGSSVGGMGVGGPGVGAIMKEGGGGGPGADGGAPYYARAWGKHPDSYSYITPSSMAAPIGTGKNDSRYDRKYEGSAAQQRFSGYSYSGGQDGNESVHTQGDESYSYGASSSSLPHPPKKSGGKKEGGGRRGRSGSDDASIVSQNSTMDRSVASLSTEE